MVQFKRNVAHSRVALEQTASLDRVSSFTIHRVAITRIDITPVTRAVRVHILARVTYSLEY